MTFSVPLGRLRSWVAGLLVAAFPAMAAPSITGFTPDFGPPGTQVRIFGSGFPAPRSAPPQVRFGNMSVDASVLGWRENEILVVVPDRVQLGPITVFTPQGFVTSRGLYYAPPRIEFYPPPRNTEGVFGTKIIGDFGDFVLFEKPVVGTPNSTLTIFGANFFVPGAPGLLVRIGSNAIPASATAENQIQANIPAVVLTGRLSVHTTAGGTTNTTEYIYGAPRIEAFTTNGAAGDSVNIKGINFLVQTPNQLQVRFGGGASATEIDIQSNTNLVVKVPVTAVTGPLTVAAPGGTFITTSNFSVLPKVTVFAPNHGPPGTVVTVVGSGLSGTQRVLFGTVAASTSTITNLSSAQITAVVPSGVITGPISVITGTGTNVTENLFYGPPQISSFTPSSGQPGASVTLNGVNLLGATSVEMNGLGIPQFTVLDNARILFAVPANATSGRFTVIGPGGTNQSSGSFIVLGRQPLITSFGPRFGPAGTKVTLVGNNLSTVTRVTFNGVEAAFTLKTAASLETTVPASATTGKIRVTNPEGSADTVEDFVVGSTADLRVTFGATPNPAVAFGPVTFNLLVVNNGPIPAANTQVEVILPPGLAYLEASTTAEVSGQTITFDRGTMEPQGFFSGWVRASAGNTNENRIVIARALSSTPDPVPGDNERRISLAVALPALNVELLSPAELLLSWPSAAAGLYSPRTASTLDSIWTPAPGTPENDGSRIQLVVPATNAVRFFRLDLN